MVREGYKQTEIGVIPEDWKVEKFQDITEVITCGIAATPTYVTEATGEPFLSAQNVRDGKVVYENHKFISKKLFIQITKHNKPSKGDILYTRVGAGIGEAGVIEDDFKFAIYVSLTLIKPKHKLVDSYFICNLLNSNYYKFLAKNGQFTGAGVQNLNVEVVRNFAIPLPPKKEQQAIGQALSGVDDLIAALDKLIAKKRSIKTGTMQQLLAGKKRLPGFGKGKGYKKTEVGLIPEDWNVSELGEIGKFKNGINKGSEDFGHGSPFVNLMDVFGISSISEVEHLGLVNSNDAERKVYDLQKGDVLFIRSSVKPSGVGLTTIVTKDLPNTVYSGFLIRFRERGELERDFKKYCFSEEKFRQSVIANSTVSANTNINQDSLRKLNLAYPKSLEEQRLIAQVLSDMDTEITVLETRRAKTQAIKQGMMQELLTGKTRLI